MLPFDYLRSFSQIRQLALATLSRKTVDLRNALDIRKILPPLDGCSSITRGLARAGRSVLDAEEVTISPSTNTKG